ncbi:MAG: DUF2147 domain-containing protein [Chitinophagaceae bacterium]
MKMLLTLFLTCFFQTMLFAQQTADAIVGNWKNGEGTGIIQIYKTTSGHYAGKIIWLKEPIDPETGKPKLDKRNPDKAKRTNPTLGLINMWGFSFNAKDQEWANGHIYDPKKGKEYSCKLKLKDKNTLDVRGYIGISLIGRTDTWTREK